MVFAVETIAIERYVRRDQRALRSASRAAGRPYPLSTTPVPLRKARARHERHWHCAA